MTLDDRLKRAADTLGDRFREDIARELASLSHEWTASSAAASASDAWTSGAVARLAEAMRAIDYAKSLSDILETLATAASNEAARAAIFLVRGTGIRSFRLFGFPAAFEDTPIEMPLSRAGVLRDAIAQRILVTGADSPFDELPEGVQATAIPLVLAGTAVGALYAEGADIPMLEVLTRFASRAIEAQTAMKAARAIAEGLPADDEVDVV